MAKSRKSDPPTPEIEVMLTPRQRFAALLRDAREEHPEMSSGELADLIAATLPDDDRQLVEEYLSSEARNILALELNRQSLTNRQQIFHVIDLKNPKAPPVRERSERVRTTLYERIERWREYIPSQRGTRELLDMTRDELRESAQFDMGKTYYYAFKARLKLRLAENMNATQSVADLYSAEQIVDLTERIKKEMSRGNFRLKVTPVDTLPGTDSVQG